MTNFNYSCRVKIECIGKDGRVVARHHTGCSTQRSDEDIIRWAKRKYGHPLAERVQVHISRPNPEAGYVIPSLLACLTALVGIAFLLVCVGCATIGDGRCRPGDRQCEAAQMKRLERVADEAAAIQHNIDKRLCGDCYEHQHNRYCRH